MSKTINYSMKVSQAICTNQTLPQTKHSNYFILEVTHSQHTLRTYLIFSLGTIMELKLNIVFNCLLLDSSSNTNFAYYTLSHIKTFHFKCNFFTEISLPKAIVTVGHSEILKTVSHT